MVEISFIADMQLEKFEYHVPFHRQYVRLGHANIVMLRTTLTNITRRAIELLRPIVAAQLISVLDSRVLAMDEMPIKAGPRSARARCNKASSGRCTASGTRSICIRDQPWNQIDHLIRR